MNIANNTTRDQTETEPDVAPAPQAEQFAPVVTDDRKWHRDCIDTIGSHPAIDHLTAGQRQNVAAVARYVFEHSEFPYDGHLWCPATYSEFATAMGNVHRSQVREGLRGGQDNHVLARAPHPDFRAGYRFLHRVCFEQLAQGFADRGNQPRLFDVDRQPERTERANRLQQLELQFSGVLRTQQELREEFSHIRSQIADRDQAVDDRISSLEARLQRLEGIPPAQPVGPVGQSDRFPTISHSPSCASKDTIPPINHSPMVYESRLSRPVGQSDRVNRFELTLEILANPARVDEWFEWALATGHAGNATTADRERVHGEAARVVRKNLNPTPGTTPPGVRAFVKNVQKKRWFASLGDEAAAKKAIDEMDAP